MHAPIELERQAGLTGLLKRELALSDTRVRTITRITGCTTFVVALAMVFQIPLPAYVAYLVFLVSREDAASTLITSVGLLAAVTLAVVASLLLYVLDAAEPALRIPLLAASTLAGTFFARTSRLGPIAFLAGFILVLSQTLLDDVPTPEFVTHMVLWLWVVISVPLGVTVLADLLTGESPVALARKRATQLMEVVATYIENPYSADPSQLRDELLALGELKNKAYLWNKQLKGFAREDSRIIATLLEILQIARSLRSSTSLASRHCLAASIRRSRHLFLQHRGLPSDVPTSEGESDENDPIQAALHIAIGELLVEASGKASANESSDISSTPRQPAAKTAIDNRPHARFAFKVMCAVLASYVTYTLLDWPGARTAITTCFFVSLTTVGESAHKLTLRITGAIIGGLIAGLCIVFVLPSLTDIGQLCLLIAAVSVFCAWISTSSETIAYAGMQIAFAFFLGVLQGYSPANGLTVLRDRLAGIMIGNVWITIFFTTLWPASALGQARDKWSSALQKLGELLVAEDRNEPALIKTDICKKNSEATTLNARALFEWRFLPREDHEDRPIPEASHIDQLTSAVFVVLRLKEKSASSSPIDEADKAASRRLVALSKGTRPNSSDVFISPTTPTLLDQARKHLDEEIDRASRAI